MRTSYKSRDSQAIKPVLPHPSVSKADLTTAWSRFEQAEAALKEAAAASQLATEISQSLWDDYTDKYDRLSIVAENADGYYTQAEQMSAKHEIRGARDEQLAADQTRRTAEAALSSALKNYNQADACLERKSIRYLRAVIPN